MVNKVDLIKRNDDELFANICKLIFKKALSSLSYISPLVLYDLLKLTKTNKYGLGLFTHKVKKIFDTQNEDMKSSKRLIYNKVSKFLPYETPTALKEVS